MPAVGCLLVISVVSGFLQPHGLWPARLLCPWDCPGKNTSMGCHSLPQGIFPNPEIEPGSPTVQADSLSSEPPGRPCVSQSEPHHFIGNRHGRSTGLGACLPGLCWVTLDMSPRLSEEFACPLLWDEGGTSLGIYYCKDQMGKVEKHFKGSRLRVLWMFAVFLV